MDTAPAVGVNYFQYKNFFLTFLQAVVTAEATVVEEATLNSPAAMAAATNKAEATKRILPLPCGFHLPVSYCFVDLAYDKSPWHKTVVIALKMHC